MSIVINLKGKGAQGTNMDLRFPHLIRTGQGIGNESQGNQGGATKILWIGYPPSVQIHEQMLYNALIPLGEIEWIRSFPAGQHAFVGFRSVEEARCAKNGLQGKLFNDPRIQILYSNVEIGLMDDPTVNSSFMTPSLPRVSPSPSSSGLQFGSVQRFGPVRTIYSTNQLHVTETRRSVYLPTPALTVHNLPGDWSQSPPVRPLPISAGDANVSEKKSKKAGIDEGFPTTGASDTSIPMPDKRSSGAKNIGPRSNGEVLSHVKTGSDNQIMGETGKIIINGSPGLTLPPTSPARTDQEECHGVVEESCCWQGTLAKGGFPVCNARCISVGKNIESKFPEVLNCSAKTDLDTLTKHFHQGVRCGSYYFVPETDQDAHAYQEFLHYLSYKNRSCVAKFSDGTTMFLVPPSDFSEHVLNAPHKNHIFGVVLKFLQQPVNALQYSAVR